MSPRAASCVTGARTTGGAEALDVGAGASEDATGAEDDDGVAVAVGAVVVPVWDDAPPQAASTTRRPREHRGDICPASYRSGARILRHMSELLLVVEESFASRRDAVVLPRFELRPGAPLKVEVRLRLPDGSDSLATATIDVAHVRGDRPPFAMYRFPSTSPGAIPPGTEIWSL